MGKNGQIRSNHRAVRVLDGRSGIRRILPIVCSLWIMGLLSLAVAGVTAKERDARLEEEFQRRNNLAVGYLDQHRYPQAVSELRRVLKIDPDHLPAKINLGLAYHHLNQQDDALGIFKEILRKYPDQPYAQYNIGLIHKARGELDRAETALLEVLRLDPEEPSGHYHLGIVYIDQRRFDDAVRELQRTVELVPNAAAAYYNLARAFRDAGQMKEFRAAMTEFQRIKSSGMVTDETEKCITDGKYLDAMVVTVKASADFSVGFEHVRLVDGTEKAGLSFRHGGSPEGLTAAQSERRRHEMTRTLASAFGSGAAFGDYDGDGDLDLYLYLVNSGQNALYRNNGDGTFRDVTEEAGVGDPGLGLGCAFGDYDRDKDLDLYVTNCGENVLYRNNGDGTFTDVTEDAGLGDPGFGLGALFCDYDRDADLDLYVVNYTTVSYESPEGTWEDLPGARNVLYRNNGDGTFADVTEDAGLGGEPRRSMSAVFFDVDADRAPDLYVVNDDGPNLLYCNKMDRTFQEVGGVARVADPARGRGASIGDYNADGHTDLFVTAWPGERNVLYRNRGDGTFEKDRSPTALLELGLDHGCWGAGFVDLDNDADLDLMVIAEGGAPQVFGNDGVGGFSDVSDRIGLTYRPTGAGRGAAFGDIDGDGDVDALITNNGGTPTLLVNEGGNRNGWVELQLRGDMSNRDGIGVTVEAKARTQWQKRSVAGASGYLSSQAFPVTLGFGGEPKADVIRVFWPRGILQSLTDVPVNQSIPVIETQVEPPSCPILFAWDGERYRFVTDFLGNGVIGYLLEPGLYNPPDSDEYVKIQGDRLRDRDGIYTVSVVEPLNEIAYLDEAKLLVVDHPSDVEVYPNERFQTFPPFPKPEILVVKDARPPVRATDDRGEDILPLISERDRRYPEGFEHLAFQGFAEQHSITLDLGDLSDTERILLILYGWTVYSSSSSDLAAWQAGLALESPRLEVVDERGDWITAMEDMGFPAGQPKAMTVDLTGRFPKDDYRIRITTNMPIYWDQILVSTFDGEVPLRVTVLRPARAELRKLGYPTLVDPDGRKPLVYQYDEVDPLPRWVEQTGAYTRYGDVTELLECMDDMYAIMGSGDEIRIEFSADRAGVPPHGWSRDFLFYADGYNKDADPNSALGGTVEPLPFHGMSGYPYGQEERYPSDEAHVRYLREYNTRWVEWRVGK